MDAPVYTPVATGSRLYASSAMPPGGFAGYWCSAGAAFGATATLAQTWADEGGFYVFAQALPADLPAFASQLAQLAPRLSPTGLVKVLWLGNGGATPWAYWPYSTLTALPQAAPSGAWALVTPAQFVLGDYRVQLAAASSLSLQNDPTGYALLLPAAAASFAHGSAIQAATATVSLALAGPNVGAWSLPLRLQPQQPDPLDQLGVMLRYATTPDPADTQATAQNLARYLSMPVLRLHTGSLSAKLVFDPAALLDPQRSYLDLAPAGAAPYALSSAFVTTLGYSITLTPRAALGAARSGRLAFCKSPLYAAEGDNQGNEVFHLAPDGCFTINVQVPMGVQERRALALAVGTSADKDQWMLGNSGAEYASLDASTGDVLVCAAGGAAYVPSSPAVGVAPLNTTATTAYITLLPGSVTGSGLPYYAQPLQAPLFRAASDLGSGFLDFHTMPAGSLPAQTASLTGQFFPVGAYRWLAAADIDLARTLEAAVLAPVRRGVIAAQGQQGLSLDDDPPPLASTPQGLLAQLSPDGSQWAGVLFANLPSSAQQLVFTPVGDDFAKALQSNQLFFVVADAQKFLSESGAGSGGLDCTLDGWTFKLNPADWRTQAQPNPTLMLFKYCNRTLMDLAGDTSAWGWPAVAGNLGQTQQQLQTLLTDARTRAQAVPPVPGDPYVIFYNEVANNPAWNGVLFLNVPVDLGTMPPDLKFLAAGIDPTQFYAHHVGFSVTPVSAASGASGASITPGQTAAFALIDYEDPQDLAPSSTTPFGFKTLQLKIRFANARIADFAAQCELMVNTLFGAPLAKQDPSRGNNLIMLGSCQRVAGVPSYSFVLNGSNLFNAQGSALVSVEVLAVRIDTATASDGNEVTCSFTLQGNLRFRQWANFDLFSYGADDAGTDGYLRFTGLAVRMQFSMKVPTDQTFTAFESATGLDSANSQLRRNALAANFPLRVAGIEVMAAGTSGQGLTPEQMGYVSIACPVEQAPLSAPWYGLVFTVDLGSLGALSGSIGLSMEVLTAWTTGPDNDNVPVYLGLKLASYTPGGGSLPLQGVLKLGFRSFEFIAYQASADVIGYQLWMRRFALSVLCWSFPPGNADLVLFGATSDGGSPSGDASQPLSLGWYAAYDAKPDGTSTSFGRKPPLLRDTPAHQQRIGRRVPPVA